LLDFEGVLLQLAADEVGPVGIKPLLRQKVDLAQVDR